jgi:predicted SAM-dependent methyltransferase
MKAEDLFNEIVRAGLLLDNNWINKQSDSNDARTSHIYRRNSIDELNEHANKASLTESEFSYAIHRWRNFKRHEAWLLLILEMVPGVELIDDVYSKTTDFTLTSEGVKHPFDLKVSRYPRSVSSSLSDLDLANWFYENQSKQGRFHLANRFFAVGTPENAVYDISLARNTLKNFSKKKSAFRHFVKHKDSQLSRAVILCQSS